MNEQMAKNQDKAAGVSRVAWRVLVQRRAQRSVFWCSLRKRAFLSASLLQMETRKLQPMDLKLAFGWRKRNSLSKEDLSGT